METDGPPTVVVHRAMAAALRQAHPVCLSMAVRLDVLVIQWIAAAPWQPAVQMYLQEGSVKGISRHTGKIIEGTDYLRERIQSALTMRIGTSVMRRAKGSRLPELIDAPANARNLFEIQLAALDTLKSPENGIADIDIKRVEVSNDGAGKVLVTVTFTEHGTTQQVCVTI